MTIKEMQKDVSQWKPHIKPVDVSVIAEHGKCECGEQMEYRGFKLGFTYRAFAVCKKCDRAEEF